MKPRNFTAKNSPTTGSCPHKDKKRAEKNGDKNIRRIIQIDSLKHNWN